MNWGLMIRDTGSGYPIDVDYIIVCTFPPEVRG